MPFSNKFQIFQSSNSSYRNVAVVWTTATYISLQKTLKNFSATTISFCFLTFNSNFPFFLFQGDDFEVHRRKKRQVTDANGNRVLRVVKRDATEMAEVETTERIIQVKKSRLKCLFSQAAQYI